MKPAYNFGRRFGSALFLVLSALLAWWLVANRQVVLDQVALLNYHPSTEIAAIAARTTMTDGGRKTFYASRPELDDATTFNTACGKSEQGSAVLGCYTGFKIYIYDVTDQQLDGIHEVTAAHEMLHAEYQRMGASEKQSVNALLEQEYAKLSKDAAFADRMGLYARTEPGERDNELHSIIGTEIASISPELEKHYAQYFTNRQTVVALHDKYASVFTRLQSEAAALSAKMDALSAEIKSRSATYDQQSDQLNADIAAFNQRASGGQFSSNEQFSAERADLVARVRQLNNQRVVINGLINRYNETAKEYNSIATQTEQLNQSINSNLAPAPSL